MIRESLNSRFSIIRGLWDKKIEANPSWCPLMPNFGNYRNGGWHTGKSFPTTIIQRENFRGKPGGSAIECVGWYPLRVEVGLFQSQVLPSSTNSAFAFKPALNGRKELPEDDWANCQKTERVREEEIARFPKILGAWRKAREVKCGSTQQLPFSTTNQPCLFPRSRRNKFWAARLTTSFLNII